MKKRLSTLFAALVCLTNFAFAAPLGSTAPSQKFENLAPTPPMGWNTWNTFAGNINETLIKDTAQALIKSGMRDAGYNYVVLDDCWALRERDADGQLVPDPEKFPSGMKALGDYLHANGFKFGIYGCAGAKTCGGYPGGRGHEFQDARQYAGWGVDYLKYDWCEHGTADARETYRIMRDALRAAGRPIVLSMCEWGQNKPWEWAADTAHLWRTTGDIYDSYDGKKAWETGWKNILDAQVGLEVHVGPGHWNDPDMLEVGNEGLTLAESRAHFSFWCMLAAPLMAGNDVRKMSDDVRAILTNREAIAVNQDKLGKQGFRALVEPSRNIEVWAKELDGGEWAFCALNTSATRAELTIEWNRFHFLKGAKFSVRDIWAKRDAGDTTKNFAASVDSHDVIFARLIPIK